MPIGYNEALKGGIEITKKFWDKRIKELEEQVRQAEKDFKTNQNLFLKNLIEIKKRELEQALRERKYELGV